MAPSRALVCTARRLRAPASLKPRPPHSTKCTTTAAPSSQPSVAQMLTSAPRPTIRRYSNAAAATAAAAAPPEPPEHLSPSERDIFNKLAAQLSPSRLEVQDISGGCGSMYALDIVSPVFGGLSVVQQHKLVNRILAVEIKGWHGVQLKTKAP